MMRLMRCLMAGTACSLAVPMAPVGATTLADALAAAYQNNPTLASQRASLRATDENAAIARASGRPQVSTSADYSQGLDGLRPLQGYNRAVTAGVNAALSFYQGGRVRNAIRAADQRSAAGREQLSGAEGDIFTQTVNAYVGVIRDREIVRLNQQNVAALDADATSSNDRYHGGDLTLTDVDQSQARLLVGRTQLDTARANLTDSEQEYRRLTGQIAGELDPAPPLPQLPINADDAENIAVDNSPAVRAAVANIKAAHYDVGTARGSRLPTLSVSASSNYYNYLDRIGESSNSSGNASQVGVTLNLPLYQGGQASARVRQARDVESQALEQKVEAERQAAATARESFSRYEVIQGNIDLLQHAVTANERALKGVRIENTAGFRQVLDVLNAQLELVNAQVSLATARSDAYVAAFQLLNAMGYANYKHLGLTGGALYDPTINFRHAVHAVSDFGDGPQPQATTSYVDQPHVARVGPNP